MIVYYLKIYQKTYLIQIFKLRLYLIFLFKFNDQIIREKIEHKNILISIGGGPRH